MPVDFVPDACTAVSIFNCLTLKTCSLEGLISDLENPASGLSAGFEKAFGIMVDAQVTLDAMDACIVAAVTAAFAAAGEPLPAMPIPDAPLDYSSVSSSLTDMVDEITTPLGILDSIFSIEDDGTKITRIQSA